MINCNRKRVNNPSFVPKFSDPDIIKAVVNSDFWKYLFLGDKKAFWLFFKAIVNLKTEMFISPLKTVLRYGHGRRTIGIMITLLSAFMMMAFNTESVIGALATFFPFVAPAIPFLITGEELKTALFVNIRSVALMYFWLVYLVLSIVHLVWVYQGSDETLPPSIRGIPILHVLLFRYWGISPYAVRQFVEPILAAGIGYILINTDTDFTFGLFLIIAAACLFFQELVEAVKQFSLTQ